MQVLPRYLVLAASVTVALSSCAGPEGQYPFQGRNGNSLDTPPPPRYGDTRYTQPTPPAPPTDPRLAAEAAALGVDPRNLPPGASMTPPPGGTYSATPGSYSPPVGVIPPPPTDGATPPPSTAPQQPVVTTPPTPPAEVRQARAVPGKPGFVYSPRDPSKMISVEGIRPGSKAKDPDTGEIFIVPPYQ